MTSAKIRAESMFNSTPLDDLLRPEIWRRKVLASTTFGIELRGLSVILEEDWDKSAQRVQRGMGTCHPLLDEFFATRFTPMSTSWIHHHPELDKVAAMFDRYVLIMRGHFDFTKHPYADRLKQRT